MHYFVLTLAKLKFDDSLGSRIGVPKEIKWTLKDQIQSYMYMLLDIKIVNEKSL